MPSQTYGEVNTRPITWIRSETEATELEPTLFIPFPSNTLPNGPAMIMMRIMANVLR